MNEVIESILKDHNVKTVLDLTCGTGSQVIWLAERGYKVVGSDFNMRMLEIAKRKVAQATLYVTLIKGDMRNVKVGTFDAVITVFNAVGHLTKDDFEAAMRNIHSNLKDGGLYIFDINNLGYLIKDNNITSLTIDWQQTVGDTKARYVQHSTIEIDGILASYTTAYEWIDARKPKISRETQTLQTYTAQQLRDMLHGHGFAVLDQCGIDGSQFVDDETECIMTIAQKR